MFRQAAVAPQPSLFGKLCRFYRKYAVLLKKDWAVMVAYRSESIIWMVGAFIQPLVSMAVWLSISGSGTVGGYSSGDYIRYFLGVLLVERLTRSWDVWEVDSSIREGTFSAKLLRPFHPIHWSITGNLVYKMFYAALLVPAWFVLALIFPMLRLPVDAAVYVLVVAAIILSSAVRLVVGYQFGILAFWTNRATSIYMLYEGIHLLLAGRLAPLTMFPEWVSASAVWLPFYATVGFPVELMTGKLAEHPEAIVQGFASLGVWLTIFLLLFRLQWREGLKKYGAVGG